MSAAQAAPQCRGWWERWALLWLWTCQIPGSGTKAEGRLDVGEVARSLPFTAHDQRDVRRGMSRGVRGALVYP